jgi:hypothetical protein
MIDLNMENNPKLVHDLHMIQLPLHYLPVPVDLYKLEQGVIH